MATIHQIFNKFKQNPQQYVGLIWQTRMDFLGLKQKEVAAAAGISVTTLNRIITKKQTPERRTVDKVDQAITVLARRH